MKKQDIEMGGSGEYKMRYGLIITLYNYMKFSDNNVSISFCDSTLLNLVEHNCTFLK